MIIIFILLILGVIALSIVNYFKNKAFKETIVKAVLEEVLGDFHYGITKGFDKKFVYDTQLVDKGNQYTSSDYVKGVYEGIPFEFSNVKIENTYTLDDTTYTDTYFKGQWLTFDVSQSILGKLYMIDKDFRFSSPHRSWFFRNNELQKVDSESIGFNKEFRVYAKDVHEAFYILSPQRIMKFYDKHQENFSFYLQGRKLHIAIYTKKFIFNDQLFKSQSEEEKRTRVKQELYNILDYLKILDV